MNGTEITPDSRLPEVAPLETGIAQSLEFIETVFTPEDVVLFRPVETYTENNKKVAVTDYDGTLYLSFQNRRTAPRLAAKRAEKMRTNSFFGVNPRFGTGGRYDKAFQIRIVHVLWSDIDHTTVEDALKKIESAGLPRPSIIVSSGNGVHVYWILDTPYLIDDVGEPPAVDCEWVEIHGKKKRIEYFVNTDGEKTYLQDPKTGRKIVRNEPELSPKAMWIQDVVHGIGVPIGGDHTHDLARLLRLPGTLNRKDQRNGAEPRPCVMVENNGRRYSIDLFAKFAESSPGRSERDKIKSVPLPSRWRMTDKRKDTLNGLIWACGSAQAGDRSEFDFKLCCWCIEHGLTTAEVWPQVSTVGKFAERGEDYFTRTWSKAEIQTRCTIAAKAERSSGTGSRPQYTEDETSDGRVEIEITTHEHDINTRVIEVIRSEDSLYQRGGALVTTVNGDRPDEIVKRPDDAPRIATLPLATVRELISKHCDFYNVDETADGPNHVQKHVPDWCVRAVHARAEWSGVRSLRGIVNHPVMKPDGSILAQPGYDSQTGLFLHWCGEPLQIPDRPTRDDAIAAATRLKTIVADFPFDTDAHRSGWLAFLLTGLIRHASLHPITCPLFLLDASIRGSGKTLLADLVGMIVCGFALPRMILPKDDDELRKHMLCMAMAGDEFALFDNVAGELGGPTLDAVLTGTQIKDRLLGESRAVSVAINTTFVVTANNCSITGDLCRRTIHIRLSSALENPEERNDFKIPNVLEHVRAHRNELLIAAFTILRGHVVAERPDVKLSTMGSFDDWSALVRGPLVWCGEVDPWETRIEFASRADSSLQTLAEILQNWPTVDPDNHGVTAAEVLQRLDANPQYHAGLKGAVCDLCNCKPGIMPTTKTLGKRLGAIRDRVHQGRRLVSQPNRVGVMVWNVESVNSPAGFA